MWKLLELRETWSEIEREEKIVRKGYDFIISQNEGLQLVLYY
jgi:hypothetical protein